MGWMNILNDVDKERQFLTYSNEGLYMTDIGISGAIECKGLIEIINKFCTSSNIMCKYTKMEIIFLHNFLFK